MMRWSEIWIFSKFTAGLSALPFNTTALIFTLKTEMKCNFYSVSATELIHISSIYCAQVSIAGQPGGVEAARVKIRVSLAALHPS